MLVPAGRVAEHRRAEDVGVHEGERVSRGRSTWVSAAKLTIASTWPGELVDQAASQISP